MQKTFTVDGKKFTGKQIAKLFDENEMTVGEDYIFYLNGVMFFGNYRHDDGDDFFAPVCNKEEANCIRIEPENNYLRKSIWIWL